MKTHHRRVSPLYQFFALTFAFTWAFWIFAAIGRQNVVEFPTIVLHTLGGLAPSLVGIWMVRKTHAQADWLDFWRRVIDFRRIGLWRTLGIFLLFPTAVLASIIFSDLLGANRYDFSSLRTVIEQPIILIPLLLMGIITGPLAEELGWRGFALDDMQKHWGALRSSLILALIWWGWHLPLFFIRGTSQYKMGIGTVDFWVFLLTIFPLTFIMTWFYNKTQGSVLSAILLHYAFNVTASLFFPLPLPTSLIFVTLLCFAAAGLFLMKPLRLPKQKYSSAV